MKAFSLLRFFVALDKEMTRRHAQWLIVIKKTANTKTREDLESSNPAMNQTANAEPVQTRH